jgi:hypothetical protein
MVVVINPSERKPSMGKSITHLSSVTRVGLDLAKNALQLHAVDAKGEAVVTRAIKRGALLKAFHESRLFNGLPPTLTGRPGKTGATPILCSENGQ